MNNKNRAVWAKGCEVFMIDQTQLPFQEKIYKTDNYTDSCKAIKNMLVRGAGSIGVAGAFAMMQAAMTAPAETYKDYIVKAKNEIANARPTAADLSFAVERVFQKALVSPDEAIREANLIADENAQAGKNIGIYGNALIPDNAGILTHCNAGPLAIVEYGSALAPIIKAWQCGKNIKVYVDETRPRNQGAKLTAWELQKYGVPHVIIADNAAGLLMKQGKIALVITGADRIAANGDTANKIGTYEKAVVAKECNIPFYVAAPDATFDKHCASGDDIVIEERHADELLYMEGPDENGIMRRIRIANPASDAYNPAFDITPAKYIKAFIGSHGVYETIEEYYAAREKNGLKTFKK